MGTNVGTAYVTISADTSRLNAQVDTATKGIGKKFKGMAAGLGIALGGALAVKGLGSTVRQFNEFEGSLAKIQGLVGIAGSEVAKFGDLAKELGPKYGKSAQEAADALFFITSAGLRGADATSTLEASLKASAVGLGDVATVADLATSAMNAYGSDTLSASSATDVMVATVREGKLSAEELAESMGRTLPLASAMGVEFNEVGAAFAALSRTGTNASEAATQIRSIFSGILRPTKQAQEELAKYGLTAKGLQESMEKRGLLATLKTLTTTIGENDESLAQVFPNIRSLSGVLDLMGANAATTEKIFGNLLDTTGDTSDAWDVAAKTSGQQLAEAMETIKAKALDLGAVAAPMVVKLVKGFSAFVDAVKPAAATIKDQLVAGFQVLQPLVSPLLAALKGLGKAFQALAANALVVKAALVGLMAVFVVPKLIAFGTALGAMALRLKAFALGARGATASSMGLAVGLTAAQAGLTRMAAAARIARGALAAMGGPIGLAITAGLTLATIIGGDLIRSFGAGKSAAERLAEANRDAARAVRDLTTAGRDYARSQISYEEALDRQAQTTRDVAVAEANLKRARTTGNTKQIATAEKDLERARRTNRTATLDVRDAGDALTKSRVKEDKALKDGVRQVSRLVAAQKAAKSVASPLVDITRMSAAEQAEFALKTKQAYAAVGKTGAYKNLTKALTTYRENAEAAGNQSPKLIGRLKDLEKVKGPEQLMASLEDLDRDFPGVVKKVEKGATNISGGIGKIGGGGTATLVAGNLQATTDQIDQFGEDALQAAKDAVAEVNRVLRLLGLRNSPDVAKTVGENMARVVFAFRAVMDPVKRDTAKEVSSINANLRKLGSKIPLGETLGKLQKGIGTFAAAGVGNAAKLKLITQAMVGLGRAKKGVNGVPGLIDRITASVARMGEKTKPVAMKGLQRLLKVMRNQFGRIKDAAEAARDKFAESMESFISKSLEGFDRLTQAALDSINSTYDALTQAEIDYNNAQAAYDSAQQQQNLNDLQDDLQAATDAYNAALDPNSGAWQEDIDAAHAEMVAAQQALQDAQAQIQLQGMAAQAQAAREERERERAAALAAEEKRREEQRAHFEALVRQQAEALMAGRIDAAAFQQAVSGELNAIGVSAQTLGTVMGTTMVGQFSGAMASMADSAVTAARAVAALMSAKSKGGLLAAIRKLEAAIKRLGKKKGGGGGSKKKGRSMPTEGVPGFAQGGVVSKPTLALVGESSRTTPEIITPEKLMRQIVREEGGTGTQVRVFIGDRELTDLVRTEVVAEQYTTGRTVLAGAR